MADKSALDALNSALASNGVPVDDEDEVESPEIEEVETPDGEDDAPEGEEVEAEGEDDADETEGGDDEGEESEESDEDDEETEGDGAAETPAAKAAREKAEKTAKEEERGTGDILEDPIPKTLGPRGQERMRSLIATVKELQPDADTGRELMQHIASSNMSADEFSMALTFGRLKHSDDPEDNRRAYQILWAGIKELAPLIGETIPGVDPLEGHDDLKLKIASKEITPQLAAEVAAGRNRRKADAAAATRAHQNTQTAAQRAQQAQRVEADVKKELNALGAELVKQDPQFEAKMAVISKKDAAGNSIAKKIANTPPGLRVNAFLKAFLAVKLPAKVATPAVGKQKQQPMRAGKVPAAGGSGVRRAPKNAVEAMDFALGLK